MAILKSKDVAKMGMKEIDEKMKELRIELIKSHVATKKAGKSNPREIKRTIARLLTFKRFHEIKNKQTEPKKETKQEAKK